MNIPKAIRTVTIIGLGTALGIQTLSEFGFPFTLSSIGENVLFAVTLNSSQILKFVGLALTSSAILGIYWISPKFKVRRQLIKIFKEAKLYTENNGSKKMPKIERVEVKNDNVKAVFRLNFGVNPKTVSDKNYLFQQLFSKSATVNEDNDGSFILRGKLT